MKQVPHFLISFSLLLVAVLGIEIQLGHGSAPQADYGISVAISGDLIVVGEPRTETDLTFAGRAIMYEQKDGTWVEARRLYASDAEDYDQFGEAVAMSGNVTAVGAPYQSVEGVSSAGAVYVFESSAGWSETAKLTAASSASYDSLAWSLAVSGNFIIAGAVGVDIGGFDNAGAVYVFERSNGGVWAETAKLTASDPGTFARFGTSVAISSSFLVVGAPSDTSAGVVYVFELSGGVWVETAKLSASGTQRPDYFGRSVAVSGKRILVGSPPVDPFDGAVYVFDLSSDGEWVKTGKLRASDPLRFEGFGGRVAISGNTAVVTDSSKRIGDSYDVGAVYTFQWSDDEGRWVTTSVVTPSNVIEDSVFGRSLAVSGKAIVVGAGNYGSSGTAYVVYVDGEDADKDGNSLVSTIFIVLLAVALVGVVGDIVRPKADNASELLGIVETPSAPEDSAVSKASNEPTAPDSNEPTAPDSKEPTAPDSKEPTAPDSKEPTAPDFI